MTRNDPCHNCFAWALCALLAVLLTGCGPTLNKVVREDPAAGGFVAVDAASARAIVSVTRGGRPLNLRLPLVLQPGDIIETGAGGAVLRLENGEAVLAPGTRVKLGSLEVIFGRVFASVRGLFRAEDDSVAADVEGTQFMFERQPGRATRVVVLEGVVRCSSKSGAWAAVRVPAGQRMQLNYRGASTPNVRPASPGEIADIRHWSERIRQAPKAGYCCAGGRVFSSLSNTCQGRFSDNERDARYQCTPGWCCAGGRVTAGIRTDCRGGFYTNQRSAIAACTEPSGWCCSHGQVSYIKQSQCKGSYFGNDSAAAKRACTPTPPPSTTGTVVKPPAVPILQMLKIKQIWCCIGGDLIQLDAASCTRRRGTAYDDERTARQRCVVIK